MQIIKKINNNVAEAIDSKGNHLIAFGKGIGFPKVPYELTDVSLISMTFYRLDAPFEKLISELSEDLLDISVDVIEYAGNQLTNGFNANLVFSLADHISFAIERMKKYKEAKLYFSTDIEQLYPTETEIGKYAVDLVKKRMNIVLPKAEISSIAMHFVNSQEEFQVSQKEAKIEDIIDRITTIVETELDLKIDRDEFNYNRFRMHVRYYLKRTREDEQFLREGSRILNDLKEQNFNIYHTAELANELISSYLGFTGTKDEILYMMIHINRLYEKNSGEIET